MGRLFISHGLIITVTVAGPNAQVDFITETANALATARDELLASNA